jgi:hypothetical protein
MRILKKFFWTATILGLGVLSYLLTLRVDTASAYWAFSLPWGASVFALMLVGVNSGRKRKRANGLA